MNVATMDEKRFRSAMRDILRASELETHPSPLSSSSQQAARISTSYSVYPRCIDYKLSAVGKIYVPSNTYQNLSLLENQLGQADWLSYSRPNSTTNIEKRAQEIKTRLL
jgi:hypothetical protein